MALAYLRAPPTSSSVQGLSRHDERHCHLALYVARPEAAKPATFSAIGVPAVTLGPTDGFVAIDLSGHKLVE